MSRVVPSERKDGRAEAEDSS